MKIVKRTFLILLLVLLIITAIIAGYLHYLKPTYEGKQQALKNIKQRTTVYFDDFGVPHIYANTEEDALTTLGYVHAQDRLWQMELMRRIAPGKLSEIFGSVMLKNDKFFSGLGIDESSEIAIQNLDKTTQTYKLTMAYIDGINQYLEEGKTPIEFQILSVEKQKFTLKDVYNIFGYMSFSFAMAQKSDPLITDIRDQYGIEYLKDFGLDGSLGTKQLKSFKGKSKEYSEISKSITSLLNQNPTPQFIGSNSWVIGQSKTKNGKVIFANDPHIGFSQPCTWYEAHINTPNYEIYGYYLAGTPFPLLGHNRKYAYGLTMFENDDVDLFAEEENPKDSNQYKKITGFANYDIKQKTIKVKDSADVIITVKTSQHGPLLNGLLDGLDKIKPVALSWIYTQQPNHILEAVYSLSHANTIDDFSKSVALIVAPGLNIMYGDAKGNIAWITSGKLYKQDKTVNPNFILNGANGIDDKKEFLDFSKNPSATNPTWDYVYSANNQPEAIDGYLYPGYYLPKDRAKRIDEWLQPKNDWTKDEVCKMITDNTSSTVTETVSNLLDAMDIATFSSNEKKAVSILRDWKGTNNLKDTAPTVYNKWIYFYLKNTFEDEMGKDKFKIFLVTHILKQTIAAQSSNQNSPWWDNIATKNKKETRSEIVTKSFQQAIASLEKQLGSDTNAWTWNRVHIVEHQHPIGQVAALKKYFNVGPFEMSGSNEVINNLFFDYSDAKQYIIKGGPSSRRVIDFSDIENSVSILPTGQSGVQSSPHYSDQAALYNNNKFRKMKLNKEEIVKTSTKLVFNPK
jgi:penicillin amidase